MHHLCVEDTASRKKERLSSFAKIHVMLFASRASGANVNRDSRPTHRAKFSAGRMKVRPANVNHKKTRDVIRPSREREAEVKTRRKTKKRAQTSEPQCTKKPTRKSRVIPSRQQFPQQAVRYPQPQDRATVPQVATVPPQDDEPLGLQEGPMRRRGLPRSARPVYYFDVMRMLG